jgi:precorrin-6B methylase 2
LNEAEPEYIKSQKFSNPFKHIYYNFFLKENLNSIESIEKFLKKFKKNIHLVKGDTNKTLPQHNLSKIDFAFIDGGHSYETTYNDLSILYSFMKNEGKTIVCDDYRDASYITEVKTAIDTFVNKNNLKLKVIKDKFALIET